MSSYLLFGRAFFCEPRSTRIAITKIPLYIIYIYIYTIGFNELTSTSNLNVIVFFVIDRRIRLWYTCLGKVVHKQSGYNEVFYPHKLVSR